MRPLLVCWLALGIVAAAGWAETGAATVGRGDDPWQPVYVTTIPTTDPPAVVMNSGSTLIVGYGLFFYETLYVEKFELIDVSSPTSATVVATVNLDPDANAMAVEGTTLVVTDLDAKLRLFDLSVPTNPVEIGTFQLPGDADDVAIIGNLVYVADGGIRVIDITDPSAPLEVAYVMPSSTLSRSILGVVGDHLYCGFSGYWSPSGFYVFDVADPSAPAEVGSVDMGYPFKFLVHDARAYAVETNSGFQGLWYVNLTSIDVTSSASPFVINREPLYDGYDCCGASIARFGDRIVIAGNQVKLSTDPMDISINEPVDLLTPGWVNYMVTIGGYLITSDEMPGPGLKVFADPSSVVFTDGFESGDTTAW